MPKDTAYVSETSKFIQEILKTNPQLDEKRLKLRQTWWDQDPSEVQKDRDMQSSDLPMRGYEYFNYK